MSDCKYFDGTEDWCKFDPMCDAYCDVNYGAIDTLMKALGYTDYNIKVVNCEEENCVNEECTCNKKRYRLSGIPEDIKDLDYKTDANGAHYIELTEEEAEKLKNDGYYIEEYKVMP